MVRDDAAHVCMLQIYAGHGMKLADGGQVFVMEVESHIIKQVSPVSFLSLFSFLLCVCVSVLLWGVDQICNISFMVVCKFFHVLLLR